MKRAVDIGPLDAAAIRTRGGKVRLRLHFTVEQLETMLRAAMEDEGSDDDAIEANIAEVKRSVTQCNAPERESRTDQQDDDDARARASPPARVFVIEGTRAWNAWISHRKRLGLLASPPVTMGHGEHAGKRGWYFESLFPPTATGPPDSEIGEEDSKIVANL